MSKFGNQSFINKLFNAINGLKIQITQQSSTKRQIFFTLLFVLLALYLKFSLLEFCLLSIIITIIFLAEFINSTIEYTQDELFGDNYSEIAKKAKDMAAGIVLYAFLMSSISAAFLFIPKIIKLFVN